MKLQNDNDFKLNIKGLPLNITMTRYPEFNHETQEIILHMDGMFGPGSPVLANSQWLNYTGFEQREQIWIHQSTVSTLFQQLSLSLNYRDEDGKVSDIGKQLFALTPEVYNHYGNNADC